MSCQVLIAHRVQTQLGGPTFLLTHPSVCIVCARVDTLNLLMSKKGQLAAEGREAGQQVAHLSKAGVRRYSLVTDKMALIRLSVDRGGRLLLEGHLSSHEMFCQ